ncbi:MAG: NAD(P)/FAD-dependent oxidoreductase [Saprospiraceae bacterium]|nr:NAD(P)/FAD-dependent oxidoreductase [Saprospiraceae bacterium]
MTKRDFIKMAGMLGIGLPLQTTLVSCRKETITPVDPNSESVLIIGAGAAGLTAGYHLAQQGINFQILEASSTYGGRMKRTNTFADFPIPLGAEWLHVSESVFSEIVNDNSVQVNQEMIPYSPQDSYGMFQNGVLEIDTLGSYSDLKFKNSTWFDFYDQYIVPTVLPNIKFNTVVSYINYEGSSIEIQTTDGQNFSGDKLVLTVPLKILQDSDIDFTPALPTGKMNAINDVVMWPGIKVFIEFSEKFYPTFFRLGNTSNNGNLEYYDASYGQNTTRHILGLFTVGDPSERYISRTGEDLKNYILNELNEVFSSDVSQYYIQHIEQNWVNEPFIRGAYLRDNENWNRVQTLSDPVDDKIFFAGEAYTQGNDWGSVHDAARSAKSTVEALVG